MQDSCGDCLSKVVCDITGASCQKMGALFTQRKQTLNGRTTMSNTPKNTEKQDVTVEAKAVDPKVEKESKTVPPQAAESKSGDLKSLDKVFDIKGDAVFSGTPDEVLAWLKERSNTTYAVRSSGRPDIMTSLDYTKRTAESEKPSLVQRLKAAAEKLKENKKAMVILGASAVIAGLAIKNNRKKIPADDELEVTVETVEGDEPTDSL